MPSILIVVVLLTMIAAPVCSQPKPCTEAEHVQMEREAVNMRTWDSLYSSYKQFGRCDDVDAAEGYSESIARILADHWETLPRLAELIQKDKGFGQFVGLNATMNMQDVAKIKGLATAHCPTGLKKLCTKLKRDADDAIADYATTTKQK